MGVGARVPLFRLGRGAPNYLRPRPASLTYAVGTGVKFDHTAANYAEIPDTVGASITADIDVRVWLSMVNWASGTLTVPLAKRNYDASSNSYRLGVQTTGALLFAWWWNGGTLIQTNSTANTGFGANTKNWIRAALGFVSPPPNASGYTVTFYTSSDGSNWTQLGSPVSGAGPVYPIDDTNTPLRIGSGVNTAQEINGKVYYAEVRNGINGPIGATFDPHLIVPTNTRTPATFVNGTDTWTFTGTAWDWDPPVVAGFLPRPNPPLTMAVSQGANL